MPSNLHDFRPTSVGAVLNNVFCKNRSDGGAIEGHVRNQAAKECVQSLAWIGATVVEI